MARFLVTTTMAAVGIASAWCDKDMTSRFPNEIAYLRNVQRDARSAAERASDQRIDGIEHSEREAFHMIADRTQAEIDARKEYLERIPLLRAYSVPPRDARTAMHEYYQMAIFFHGGDYYQRVEAFAKSSKH